MGTEEIIAWLAAAIAAGAIAFATMQWKRVQEFTERHAAPARQIPEEQRTLLQKMAIEADRRADLLNIQKYEIFLSNWVAAYLTQIARERVTKDPMQIAEEYVVKMLEALGRRNPDLAASMDQSLETAKERLAGAITRELNKVKK